MLTLKANRKLHCFYFYMRKAFVHPVFRYGKGPAFFEYINFIAVKSA
jgi:hypothetical protein